MRVLISHVPNTDAEIFHTVRDPPSKSELPLLPSLARTWAAGAEIAEYLTGEGDFLAEERECQIRTRLRFLDTLVRRQLLQKHARPISSLQIGHVIAREPSRGKER